MKRFKANRRRFRRLHWIMFVAIAFLCICGVLFLNCRPIITAFAESQALWVATKTANRVATHVLSQYTEMCKDMIIVTYDSAQAVSAVRTDTSVVNTVRTAMTDAVMTAFEQEASVLVPIPAGTLTGWYWLSGWGPLLTFPMSYTATVLSDISTSLMAVGMNQSSYSVEVQLDISLYVVTPGGRSTVATRVCYPMAEAVLMGKVPDNLTEVYGDDQSLLGQIFDYGTTQ